MGAKLRETQRRIKSVQSTKKITKAMELIASSRILRAERRVKEARPFSDKISTVIRDLVATSEKLEHPLLERHEDAPAGYVVITADRGLAGAYNANVLRLTERTRRAAGGGELYVVGRKGINAFRFRKQPMSGQWFGFSEAPQYEQAREIGQKLIADFMDGKIGSATLVYTNFKSMFTQSAVTQEILPVTAEELEGGREFPPVYEFEPEPRELLGHLLPMYVEMKIFHALLEAAASEHAARRRAMSSASENAEDILTNLTRIANQARQSEITMEIADIVGGAEALR